MEPYQIILLIVGILAILLVIAYGVNRKIIFSRKKAIQKKMKTIIPEGLFTWHHDSSPFQLLIEADKHSFMIKIIPFAHSHELIITAPKSWCVNQSPNTWKRSSKPELVPLVSEFLDYKADSDKKKIKIALIYPGCYNITRYLNESDVELVTYSKPINGVYFVRFQELDGFFLALK